MDGTIVNVALPTIQKDLHTGLAGQQWVVEAYMLTLVSLLLVGGSLGDLFGRRRMFIAGLIGFVGLVVPHVVRLVVGPNARIVLPLSALVGACLMVGADAAARLLGDIPVGVVTAAIGAPFFLFVLRTTRSGYEL